MTWQKIAWRYNEAARNAGFPDVLWSECDDAPFSLDYVRDLCGLAPRTRPQRGCYAAQMRMGDKTFLLFKRVSP